MDRSSIVKKTLVYLSAIMFVSLAACADRTDRSETTSSAAEGLASTITDIRTTPVVTGVQTAEGGRPIIVFYKISNIGPLPIDAAAMPVPVLFNAQGVAYQPDPVLEQIVATAEGVQYDIKASGQLNPGITTYGFTVFEVADANWNASDWSVGWPGQSAEERLSIRPTGD